MKKAMSIYGHIDVLVNNAGYSLLGAVEDFSDEECHLQMETNFFAPIKIIQLVLPSMRERKSGTIVNISSVAGLEAFASCSLYAASKHALEAMTEALSREVASYNITCLLVEPGNFRTNLLNSIVMPAKGLTAAYQGTAVDNAIKMFEMTSGKQPGDTDKGCQVIFDFVTGTGVASGKEKFLRLPLGLDCAEIIRAKAETLLKTLDGLEDILPLTNYD